MIKVISKNPKSVLFSYLPKKSAIATHVSFEAGQMAQINFINRVPFCLPSRGGFAVVGVFGSTKTSSADTTQNDKALVYYNRDLIFMTNYFDATCNYLVGDRLYLYGGKLTKIKKHNINPIVAFVETPPTISNGGHLICCLSSLAENNLCHLSKRHNFPLIGSKNENTVTEIKCVCGAEIANTTHSNWCPKFSP